MRKINKNCFVFGFAVVFVIIGFCGNSLPRFVEAFSSKITTINSGGMKQKSLTAWNALHDNYDSFFSYFGSLMDVNSVKENILGTRVEIKDTNTVLLKTDTGNIDVANKKISLIEIQKTVREIKKLEIIAENSGAKFLYCAAPNKEYYDSFPKNYHNYYNENYDLFLDELETVKIPHINFVDSLCGETIEKSDIFFATDSHWKPYSGFLANSLLCEELKKRYGFKYNREYVDYRNYDSKVYPKWFLGCWGQKTGAHFSWNSPEDFELIIPRFDTDLVVEEPLTRERRSGDFIDTVLYLDKMEKDYYHISNYATYCGGNRQLQVVKNNLNSNGEKVLIIRDSFACVVTPFLSLQTGELHICDMRKCEDGIKINAENYINQIKPDYVLVLYAGVATFDNSQYDFF